MESIKIVVLALILAFTNPVLAECPNPVQPIKNGEQANCDGFLFSDQAEKDASAYKNNAEYYEELSNAWAVKSKLQTDENQILEQRLKLYMDATSNLSKEVASRDNSESLYRFVYFGLGVLVTGLIVRNVSP